MSSLFLYIFMRSNFWITVSVSVCVLIWVCEANTNCWFDLAYKVLIRHKIILAPWKEDYYFIISIFNETKNIEYLTTVSISMCDAACCFKMAMWNKHQVLILFGLQSFDLAQNHFCPIKCGLLIHNFILIETKIREFWTTVSVSVCDAACRFLMTVWHKHQVLIQIGLTVLIQPKIILAP